MSKNVSSLSGRDGKELTDPLWDRLQQAAKEMGGSPGADQVTAIADDFRIGEAMAFGTTTFYDFLKRDNLGKKAYVCNGSTCLVAGTQGKVHAELGKHFKPEEIGEMCCLGRCHENSAFHVDGRNYSGSSIGHVEDVVKKRDEQGAWREANGKHHVGTSMEQPILTAPMPSLDEFYGLWEKVLKADGADLLQEIKQSKLRGRGGAGFPMGIKLEAVRKAQDTTGNGTPRKYIVCNGDEGDPAAFSDRYLLEQRPHLVLLGMMIAGYLVGADTGVLYIRAEYPEAVESVKQAINDIAAKGWIGDNIKGSGFNYRFKVIQAAGAYICGEETALLNSIEGKRGEVRTRPPYPAEKGLFNRPTVVNNVESLACVPWIIRHGGAAFAKVGSAETSGSKLLSLDSSFNRPGIYEVECGTPLRKVIDELGRGLNKKVKAMHIGGPLGGIVPMHKIDNLTIDFETFRKEGFMLGHASILCIPEDFRMIDYLQHLFEFTAVESCGKCYPCRIGSKRGEELIHGAREKDQKIDRQLFNDLLETMEIGSLCALGGGLPLGINNALQYFGDELKANFKS